MVAILLWKGHVNFFGALNWIIKRVNIIQQFCLGWQKIKKIHSFRIQPPTVSLSWMITKMYIVYFVIRRKILKLPIFAAIFWLPFSNQRSFIKTLLILSIHYAISWLLSKLWREIYVIRAFNSNGLKNNNNRYLRNRKRTSRKSTAHWLSVYRNKSAVSHFAMWAHLLFDSLIEVLRIVKRRKAKQNKNRWYVYSIVY